MRRWVGWILLGLMTLPLGACSQQTAREPASAAPGSTGSADAAVGIPAPPSSPLSKIQLGMHKKQVQGILGAPSDENSYPTGKAWIPFYFGNDARRTSWYYKDMGRVVFADGNVFGGGTPEVVRVDYDPSESGVAR